MRNHEAIRDELTRIRDEEGRLTPEAVVAEAQEPTSVLHGYFTWDDTEAAHKHRLNEARTLIRTVRVEITTDVVNLSAVGYVRDPDVPASSQGYVSTLVLREDPVRARAVMEHELVRIDGLIARMAELAALLGMESFMSRLQVEVTGILEALELQSREPMEVDEKIADTG